MMTPGRIRYLRIKMQNKLWRRFPDASAIDIGLAVNDLLDVVLNEPLLLLAVEHDDPDCACWACILALTAEMQIEMARRAVKGEAEQAFD